MKLYELDLYDSDDLVTKLEFPSTNVTLSNCNVDGCDPGASNWMSPTESTHPSTGVDAEFRVSVTASAYGYCETW